MIVVADTGPVNYLVLIGQIDLAHALYGTLLIPPAVCRELLRPETPTAVRQWAANLPAWAEVRSPQDASRFSELGPGEREAICLALELQADWILIDEIEGRRTAVKNDLAVKVIVEVGERARGRGDREQRERSGQSRRDGRGRIGLDLGDTRTADQAGNRRHRRH